jgi:hypothetical protein
MGVDPGCRDRASVAGPGSQASRKLGFPSLTGGTDDYGKAS